MEEDTENKTEVERAPSENIGDTHEQPITPEEQEIDAAFTELFAGIERRIAEIERQLTELSARSNGHGQHEPTERNWYLRPLRKKA
jgi:hypothetical protein